MVKFIFGELKIALQGSSLIVMTSQSGCLINFQMYLKNLYYPESLSTLLSNADSDIIVLILLILSKLSCQVFVERYSVFFFCCNNRRNISHCNLTFLDRVIKNIWPSTLIHVLLTVVNLFRGMEHYEIVACICLCKISDDMTYYFSF